MLYGTKVEILIDTTIASSYALQIYKLNPNGSSNAARALLKSASDTDYIYRLGGQQWVDFSSRVKSININRGKSRFEDRMSVSSATILFNNQDGYFNRFSGAFQNPYALEFVPRRQVRISKYLLSNPAQSVVIFTGKTTSWNNNYSSKLNDVTTLTVNDALNDIGNKLLPATTFTSQLTSARINAVLDLIGWPTADRDIETGSITIQGDSIAADSNVLDYLDKVTRTEGGFFYINSQGKFTFRNRARQDVTTYPPSTDPGDAYPQLNLSDAASYTLKNGYDVLFNQFVLSRIGGGTVTVDSNTPYTMIDPNTGDTVNIPGSQDRFGVISLEQPDLLFTSDADTETLGLKYADWLGKDVDRVGSVSWEQTAIETDSDWTAWGSPYRAEMGIPCYFAPPGLVIDTYNLVASIQHNITPDSHIMTVGLLNAL